MKIVNLFSSLTFFLAFISSLTLTAQSASDWTVERDNSGQVYIVSAGLPVSTQIKVDDFIIPLESTSSRVNISRQITESGLVNIQVDDSKKLYHFRTELGRITRARHIPLWTSILPPLLAIILALIFKEVIISLFIGIWAGAFIAGGMDFLAPGQIIYSLVSVIEKYVIEALNDTGHLSVIVFSLLIGGMVALISKNGGMAGVVQSLSKYAKSERSSQMVTWVLGIAIFFDDYANTLIVGNTMRSVTDRFRISREKLAYIVDSTAAPVSAVAFITTWIGAELGYIDSGISQLSGFDTSLTPYAIFLSSLKYSFYPILTLGFIVIIIYTRKDYGPMAKAENRARSTGQVSPAATQKEDEPDMEELSPLPNAPQHWYNAVIPIAVVILVTIIGLISTGMDSTAQEILDTGIALSSEGWGSVWNKMNALWPYEPSLFMKLGRLVGNSDSYVALLWASFSGVLAALILTWRMRIVPLIESMHIMVMGFKTMLPALIILTFAWALALLTEQLHTADFITGALSGSVSPYMMPVITFILAAVIAFSTGSSWSTMAILYPIAIPATWSLSMEAGIDMSHSMELLYNVIAIVLAASVLGDHCSPISDTTILSSLASDCNHIDHVKTQMPYALTVGGASLLLGYVSTLLGGGWIISFLLILIAFALLYFLVWKFGKTSPEYKIE